MATLSLGFGRVLSDLRRMRYFRPEGVAVNSVGASGSIAPGPCPDGLLYSADGLSEQPARTTARMLARMLAPHLLPICTLRIIKFTPVFDSSNIGWKGWIVNPSRITEFLRPESTIRWASAPDGLRTG